jgi:hypothetical protein
MLATLALFLTMAVTPTARTTWMTPDAFHLAMGMKKPAVIQRLKGDGWAVDTVKNGDLQIKYDEKRTITMTFQKERLHSLRFELVDFLPEVKQAFGEREQFLIKHYGKPRKKAGDTTLLEFNHVMPNIHLVVSTDRTSSFGVQGLGFLVVRYFDPAVK